MPDFFLTIPCEPAKGPDRVAPILVYLGNDSTGAARCCYECPYCHWQFHRRKPCASHLGMFPNDPASCPVLLAEDERRRQKEFPHDNR